jgi:histidine triad (HIT) family protein
MAECVFCGIVAGRVPPRGIAERDGLVAFHDVVPQAPTHVLIVPRRHVESVDALGAEDIDLPGRMVLFAAELARRLRLDRPGYRLVFNTGPQAGQTVPHLHLHLLGGRVLGWPPG